MYDKACLVALLPLLPGAARLFQTFGADFAAVVLVAAAFAIALVRGEGVIPRPAGET